MDIKRRASVPPPTMPSSRTLGLEGWRQQRYIATISNGLT